MKNLILLSDMLKIKLSREMIPKIEIPVEKTTLYKIGFEEGKGEGLKEAILLGFELKFGNGELRKNKLNELKNLLSKIDDIRKLKKIKKHIFLAKTPDEFIKKVKAIKKSKIS
ncbi:hypothetical protein HRbin19_01619 [bacterium HR19]|nr:hypothetical protein HRbin19_01619 [bacterium HR19]